MNRTAVKSSHLISVGYDPEKRLLEVKLQDGAVYQYHDVPASLHKSLMAAESVGKHFNAHVKALKYTKVK